MSEPLPPVDDIERGHLDIAGGPECDKNENCPDGRKEGDTMDREGPSQEVRGDSSEASFIEQLKSRIYHMAEILKKNDISAIEVEGKEVSSYTLLDHCLKSLHNTVKHMNLPTVV